MKKRALSLLMSLVLLVSLLPATIRAAETTALPFTSAAGTLVGVTENGYAYDTDWDGVPDAAVDLYTLSVPLGTQGDVLTFAEPRIAYGYNAEGGYLSSCAADAVAGYAENGKVGESTAQVRLTADAALPTYTVVQTPYDDAWQSETLYAVTYEYTHTFTVKAGETALTQITATANAYEYYDWYKEQSTTVMLYTVTLPAGTTEVELATTENVLLYNYDGSGNYLAGWYSGDAMYTGGTSASVAVDSNSDGAADFIQVQTPYDASWNSTLLYAITFQVESVEVTLDFDCRSVATADMLAACDIGYPTKQTVTLLSGSTVYTALEAARTKGSFAATYGTGWDGTENGYLISLGDIGADMEALCEKTGAAYSADLFQYAGWTYSGDGVQGLGIQADQLTADTTLTFRYTVYYGAKSQTEWVNFDWDFVDAYYGIQEDITKAKALEQSTGNYSDAQWAKLQSALTSAEAALKAVEDADEDGCLSGGLMLNYIAEKGTALWGSATSPTEQLKAARSALEKAVNKVVAPTGISVPTETVEIPMGSTYHISAAVLPEGAPQGVSYECYYDGGAFTLSADGTITPLKVTTGTYVIFVKSTEDSTVSANFKVKIVDAPAPSVDMDTLLKNIARANTETSGEWWVMDMGAYATLGLSESRTSDAAKQSYINAAIASLGAESVTDTTCAKAILALTAIGADARRLYPVNSNTALDAIAGLNRVTQSTSAWSAPYTLAAYNQGDYTNTESYERALINALLANQQEDGSWSEWGTIDTTANVLAGLAFYADEAEVKTAIDKGVAYLATQMRADGTYDGGYGANANSTAMVVIGLAAVGIDPDTDARFVKDDTSVLDGLLSFALADESGFGYQDNTTCNQGATEQAFRALIAAKQVMTTGKAYNVYDFSANTLAPVRAVGSSTATAPSEPSGDGITVRVTVKADTGYWLNSKSVTLADGATVAQALIAALEGSGITQVGAANGYVSSMSKGGVSLGEFDKGENSGWLYKVNGTLPSVGVGDYDLSDGDRVVFYYTEDWTRDPSAGSMSTSKKEESDTLTPSAAVSNGTASVSVTASSLRSALSAAEKKGESAVTVAPKVSGSADAVAVLLPASAAKQIAEQGTQLVIETATARVVLSAETLAALTGNGSGTLKLEISAKSAEGLSDALSSEQLENAAAAEVTLTVNGEKVTTFGGKSLAVDIPVSSAQFRAGGYFRVLIISEDGTVEQTAGICEEKDGTLTVRVETTHLSTFVVLPETALPFTDVAQTAWYRDAVRFVYEKGLMIGVSDDSFLPDGTATRAQVVTILHRLAGQPVVDYLMQYTDVSEDAWYAEAVRWAASEGIVTGYSDDRFAPDDAVTREQLAAMLYRFVQKQGGGFTGMWYFPLRYDDAAEIGAWANEAMHWCVMRGILNGTDEKTLSPKETATRAQLAAILQRFDLLSADDGKISAAQSAYDAAAAYLTDTVSAPTVGSIGGEWTVLALTRGGADFDESAYLTALEKTLKESGGVLSTRKYTEYSRVILALTALGIDARSVAGYDLTLPLGDFDKTTAQGVNGASFALLALDSGDYPVPEGGATRQMYVDAILAAQRADGGWSLSESGDADADLTAMALQALAEYCEQSAVEDAIERALERLSTMQSADGGFASDGVPNAESCAQVLLALCALDIDADDARFTKGGCSALDALLSYQTADGGFRHIAGGDANLMASEQATCALAALVRAERGETGFYAMNETAASLAA